MPEITIILEAAESLLQFVSEHSQGRPDQITQSGGYLLIARDGLECPDFIGLLGNLRSGRYEAYNDVLVMDIALRANPEECSSRAVGSLAGGIRTTRGVRVCVGGFLGEWNVALALLLVKKVGLVNDEEFLELASVSRNKVALELADHVTERA